MASSLLPREQRTMSKLDTTSPIIIVGAGCFGASTALHLLRKGYTNVTLLDKSPEIPGPDQASNDLNRIVRSSYSDSFYAHLAKDAIREWKDDARTYGNAYHESGVLALGAPDSNFVQAAYQNEVDLGSDVHLFESWNDIKQSIPQIAASSIRNGYLNYENGWADAGAAIRSLHKTIADLGCRIETGNSGAVTGFLRQEGTTKAVKCLDGTEYPASRVILATGAWSSSCFPDLDVGLCRATGQSVAMIQLTAEEASHYAKVPVFLAFDDGFYVFPPTREHIIKMAIHGPGFENPKEHGISTPRTAVTHPDDGHQIPKVMLTALRNGLRQIFPELASKAILRTRLCWYNDSYDGDWVIGYHPRDAGIVLATGGSGHAFKFLPVLGRLVVDAMLDELDPIPLAKFSPGRATSARKADPTRHGETPKLLVVDELCSEQDYVVI